MELKTEKMRIFRFCFACFFFLLYLSIKTLLFVLLKRCEFLLPFDNVFCGCVGLQFASSIHFIYIFVYFALYSFAVCLSGDIRRNTWNEGHSLFSKTEIISQNARHFDRNSISSHCLTLAASAEPIEMLMWSKYIQVNRVARDYVTSVNLKIDSSVHLFLSRIGTLFSALVDCVHETVDSLWPWATLWQSSYASDCR